MSASRERLREFLKWADALLRTMEFSLQTADPKNAMRFAGYKQYARKFSQIALVIAKEVSLPPIIEVYDHEKMKGGGDTLAYQQQEIFLAVHANLALLKSFLETQIGVVEDETAALRDFFQARLRSVVFTIPEKEKEIQDCVESLLVGRGLQKGTDYDREVGRVKTSVKESVPDFIVPKLSLAIEVKLIPRAGRVRELVDEINADVAAYGKAYRSVLFIVYDTGHIRNENEFRQDLEDLSRVSIVIVKH